MNVRSVYAIVLGLLLPSLVLGKETRSEYGELFSEAMDKSMAYSVYTPPGWQSGEQLPLVVLLHGGGSDHKSFDKYAVGDYLDERYATGDLPRAIVLNPDGELGFWENWHDGSRRYRDWVMRDLLPVVQESYGTLPCPEHCHVMGMSMGAHGALRFIFHESDTFSSVTVISGMILSRDEVKPTLRRSLIGLFIPFEKIWGDIDDPANGPRELDPYVAWTELSHLRDKPMYLAWGDRDKKRIRETSERFADTLTESGLAYERVVYDGKHKWVDWKVVIADALEAQLGGGMDTS